MRTVLGCFFLALSALAVHAEECRAIQNPVDRLKCYDAKDPPGHTVPSSTGRMSIVDFKTDRSSLMGKPVEVEGLLMPFGESALLAGEVGDLSPVFIDIGKVEREQRRTMFACSAPCKAVGRDG